MRKLFFLMITVLVCAWTATAQTHTFHGSVVDAASNEPLVGATVMPIGGGQGVAADIDGKFTLTVPTNVTQAKISYVGYQDQVVTLRNNMVIHLSSTSENLDDLVVVAYGTANKESLTGSVAVVGSKEIEDRPVTSVTSALEGNAPGVMINGGTLQPGQSPAIRVRGFSSINGNNDALIVLDGTEYVGDIAAINPQDIESLSVLKDAASCALYGNRGANGVVLITTKKAKNVGKIDINLNIRQGLYERALPQYDRMSADDWMQTTFNAQMNGSMANPSLSHTREQAIAYWQKNYIPTFAKLNIYNQKDTELFDSNGRFQGTVNPGYTGKDMDWWDGVSRTGYRQEYTVSMAGAAEKFNAFASAGYLNEEGYVLRNGYERFSGRLNLNANPVKWFKAGLAISATQQDMDRTSYGLSATNNPFSMTQLKAPIYPYYLHDATGAVMYRDGAPVWNQEKYNPDGNIVWQIREDDYKFNVTQFDMNIYGTVVLPYGFDATVKGTMFRDKTISTEYNNNKIGSQANVGSLSKTYMLTNTHSFQQMINWAQDYGMNHVDVLLNHENYYYKYGENFDRKANQQLNGLIHMDNFSDMKDMADGQSERALESYLGRVRYNWNQTYFAEASIRRDGTSRFAKNDRWGTFWSVGASWILSKEKFMEGLTWVDYLKLRAAYGAVGNDASAGNYASWALYEFGWAVGGNVSCLVPGQLAPSGLRWESTKTLDVALEGSLFNDRLTFSVGYYNKRNADLLFWRTAASSTGAIGNTGSTPQVLQNIGTMQNIGWELQFGVDIIRTQDLKWNFSVDASFLKNKILSLPDNQNIPGQALFIGKSLYEQYTYSFAGVDQMTGRSLYEMVPDSPDYYYYDDDNNYIYNEQAYLDKVAAAEKAGELVTIGDKQYTTNTAHAGRKICGSTLPTVYGSFGTNFSWKGINLGMLFTYSLGGKTYNSTYSSLVGINGNQGYALTTDLFDAWSEVPAGMTETSADRIDPNGIPQVNAYYNSYNNAGSSRFLMTNNYLVFKNLNVSYDLPSKWVSAMKLQNLNLGMSVDNLFIAAAKKGMNPQYNFSGGQGQAFVPSRVFAFQLTAKF